MEFISFVVIAVLLVLTMYFLGKNSRCSNQDIVDQGEIAVNDVSGIPPASGVIFESVTEAKLNHIITLLGTIAGCLKFIVFVVVCWIIAKIALFVIYGTAALSVIDALNQVLK